MNGLKSYFFLVFAFIFKTMLRPEKLVLYQIEADKMPFRNILIFFFFVSVMIFKIFTTLI